MKKITSNVKPIIYEPAGADEVCKPRLLVLDQRLIPYEKKYIELKTYKDVISAIKDMVVRGAPLIGITAAYGMALAVRDVVKTCHGKSLCEELSSIANEIKNARPTAINLNWAVDLIMNDVRAIHELPVHEAINAIEKRAIWIHEDDEMRCQKMGEYGAHMIETCGHKSVLTICNTGALATGGIGTAFGVILTAYKKDPSIKVFAAETRPRQQGARLTTFEFIENGIDCTLISDTACGYLMKKGEVDLVIAGADRIASNGDTANKIGTYQLAVLAKENNIPFYIAAPLSTFDLSIKSGEEIPIEERSHEEVTHINGETICTKGVKVRNPAFDVTPAKYISGIITEKGILSGDYKSSIKNAFNETVIA
jgi:methylthioribose-1-phosphate isomerase